MKVTFDKGLLLFVELSIPLFALVTVLVAHAVDITQIHIPILCSVALLYLKFRSLSSHERKSWIGPEIIFLVGFFVPRFLFGGIPTTEPDYPGESTHRRPGSPAETLYRGRENP